MLLSWMDNVIIFDIDGTLSIVGDRIKHIEKTPKDWDLFFNEVLDDELNHPIVKLTKTLRENGYGIIISTGRSNVCYSDTKRWLSSKAGINYDLLFMRENGDFRKEHIIKKESLDKMRSYGYNVTMAFDNNSEVIEMYRENGIIGCQV